MDLGSLFFTMTAKVETHEGAGPNGDLYATAVTKAGFLDDGTVLVDGTAGQVLVSQTKWYTALDDADAYPPGTRITVNGHVGYVARVNRRDASGFGGPSHLEVTMR